MAGRINKDSKKELLYFKPAVRVFISLITTGILFFLLRKTGLSQLLLIDLLWVGFACTLIALSFWIFFKVSVAEIAKRANEEDGSRIFFFVSVILISAASLFTILLLFLSNKTENYKLLSELIGIIGMISSWVLVHTSFSFHYAHLYYGNKNGETIEDKPLNFPGNTAPDYLDFAYFSFVIGMTFQVSDVEVISKKMRRVVLAHSLLAFAFNTFVVALTINLLAGLKL